MSSIHYILVPEEKEAIDTLKEPSLSKEEFKKHSKIANNFSEKYGYNNKLYHVQFEINNWDTIQYDTRRLFLIHSDNIIKNATQ